MNKKLLTGQLYVGVYSNVQFVSAAWITVWPMEFPTKEKKRRKANRPNILPILHQLATEQATQTYNTHTPSVSCPSQFECVTLIFTRYYYIYFPKNAFHSVLICAPREIVHALLVP